MSMENCPPLLSSLINVTLMVPKIGAALRLEGEYCPEMVSKCPLLVLVETLKAALGVKTTLLALLGKLTTKE